MAQVKQFLSNVHILSKPRITAMVCLTSFMGYYLASENNFSWWTCIVMLIATALVSAGASIYNQVLEVDIDSKMDRTQKRPLPTGAMKSFHAQLIAFLISILGVALFIAFINQLAAIVALASLISYVMIYTPMKRISHLSTVVGAVPGALPPVIGWVSARNEISIEAWILFAILFLWQIPHFLAIAWMYAADYAKASLPVLPAIDVEKRFSSREALMYSLALLPASILPTVIGMTGKLYFAGAAILSILFIYSNVKLCQEKTVLQARKVLLASVAYLPLLLALMILDKQ